jgi:hypothetical protein
MSDQTKWPKDDVHPRIMSEREYGEWAREKIVVLEADLEAVKAREEALARMIVRRELQMAVELCQCAAGAVVDTSEHDDECPYVIALARVVRHEKAASDPPGEVDGHAFDLYAMPRGVRATRLSWIPQNPREWAGMAASSPPGEEGT